MNITHWLLSSLAVILSAYVLPGVQVSGFVSALLTALVLGGLNSFVKPILVILTLPINVLTLGLFSLVINALLVMLASLIVPGFKVNGFLWALLFGIVLGIVQIILNSIF